MRILLTTTSYQDTPGPHHDMLEETGFDVHRERGPLNEARMLELAGGFDAFLCGDDAITRAVLEKSMPRLKAISKYGIGVDKIDVDAATELGIPVTYCPGVNHTTVAEHTFALLLCLSRNLVDEAILTRDGHWKRMTGHEIMGKTIGIIGLGRIGKEVAKRARAFGLNVIAFDLFWDDVFAGTFDIERKAHLVELFQEADILSLHTSLTDDTRGMINDQTIEEMKSGVIILNCARGELVDTPTLVEALTTGKVSGYGADVLDEEPPPADHPLLKARNCIITPHIGSRTYESVQRQAGMATRNLIKVLAGEQPEAQVNTIRGR